MGCMYAHKKVTLIIKPFFREGNAIMTRKLRNYSTTDLGALTRIFLGFQKLLHFLWDDANYHLTHFPDVQIMRTYANIRSVSYASKKFCAAFGSIMFFLVSLIEAEMWDQSDDIFGSVGSFPEIGYTSFLKNSTLKKNPLCYLQRSLIASSDINQNSTQYSCGSSWIFEVAVLI